MLHDFYPPLLAPIIIPKFVLNEGRMRKTPKGGEEETSVRAPRWGRVGESRPLLDRPSPSTSPQLDPYIHTL